MNSPASGNSRPTQEIAWTSQLCGHQRTLLNQGRVFFTWHVVWESINIRPACYAAYSSIDNSASLTGEAESLHQRRCDGFAFASGQSAADMTSPVIGFSRRSAMTLPCPLTASDRLFIDDHSERLLPSSANVYFRPGHNLGVVLSMCCFAIQPRPLAHVESRVIGVNVVSRLASSSGMSTITS